MGNLQAGMLLLYVLLPAAIGAGLGAVIAKSKNQEIIVGVMLGGFLGCFGWIILLCLPSQPKASTSRRRRPGTGRGGTGRVAGGRPGTSKSFRNRR